MIYILIVLVINTDKFVGDEGRYVMYANNLTEGIFSPEGEIYLWSGPGYPLLLAPFVLFKLPWMAAKLLNPLFLFVGIIFFYHTLRFYMQESSAIFYSYMLGIYIPYYRLLSQLVTESFSIFLVCCFMFYLCKIIREGKYRWSQLLIASVSLGYLALTKVFFGYVILFGLLLFLFLYLWKKKEAYKKIVLVYSFALLCCTPYLFYTYSLTGKIFYWGSQGGLYIYLMSSPYDNEYGDWSERNSGNHNVFYNKISELSAIEQDKEFKREAIKNIINRPSKYMMNWISNVGRMLFNYPFSYTYQRVSNYFYIIPNMFLVVAGVLCLYPTWLGRALIPFEIYALMVFALISFGGLSVIMSENRYFWPLVPVFILWIAFTLSRLIKIEIRS